MKTFLRLFALVVCLVSLNSYAAVTVNFYQSGGNVTAVASGTIASESSFSGTSQNFSGTYPNGFLLGDGSGGHYATSASCTGFTSTTLSASSSSGAPFGLYGGMLLIPTAEYTAHPAPAVYTLTVSTTNIFSGKTLANLGLTTGTYNCTTSSPHGASDTVTIVVGAAPVPTVTSINASSGATAGGTAVTITGTNFTGVTGVTIGGVAATSVVAVSSTQVTAVTPAHVAATGQSVVVTADGGSSAANTLFSFIAPVTATQAVATKVLTNGVAATSFTPVTGGGGTAPLSYAISPALPAGLAIAPSTGAITGTPTANSSATTYTVTVTDASSATASATFSLTVNPVVTATQAVATKVLTNGVAATSFTPVTGGGGTASLSYAISPALPAGLALAPSTGAITGTPTANSSATTYTVTVTDANTATATATFSLTVSAGVTAIQAVATKVLTNGVAATSFTPVTGGGGTSPLSYTISPALPAGLALASSTGAITGTPTATSSATTYTVTVTDANNATATATFSLTVSAGVTATQAVATKVLTNGVAATSFTPVTGSGGAAPLSYSISPTLPTGLALASSTGAITGTPTATSSATTYTVTVTDANSATATATFSLAVSLAVSTDATLSGLVYSSGAITPIFTSATITYTQSVVNAVSSITVTPTVNQANATVKVNGVTVVSGSASGSINLNVGSNTITTIVTAQDGTTSKTYTTTVTRAAATIATLSGLSLSSGTLSPAFASSTTSYTATVMNATNSIAMTPTLTDSAATVKVNGTTVASGNASSNITLNVGNNTVTTVVTAQDGTTTQTYTTTVTRAALIAQAALTVTASPNVLNSTTLTSTVSTSGGSGSGAVSYAMTGGTCTLSGTTVTAGSANETCTVTATKAADGTYTSATATVAISVTRRATLAAAATDASVAKTQGTQLMQTQKFVQTQMLNITNHLDTFRHSFALTPSNLGVSVATPSLGPMAPLFYKVKDVWSGNSGESTKASLRKAGMKDADPFNVADKQPYNDYNNPEEIDQQAAIEQRIHAYERKQETYSFWTAGSIDTGLFKTGDNKDVTNKFRVNGLTFGLDYKVGPRAIVGAAFGLGYGTNASQELQSTIKSTQRSYTGYGMLGFGDNWVVDGLLGYSTLSFSGERTTSDGLATLGMNRGGDSTFASTSISKIFSYGPYRVAPFVREDLMQIRLGQYAETGGADYALGYDSASYSASTTSAGLHLSHDLYLDAGKLTSSAKLSSNRMRTGAITQGVYYADVGMAGGVYTLMQGSSAQTSRSLNLGVMYTNKAGDGIDIGWMGAMGANQYRLNGLRFGARFAM